MSQVNPPRRRLLLVDDQPINIQALHQLFAADHQVFMATSGAQALKVCSEVMPDLVLLDVQMPGMDGHEVCRRMQADPALRDIPVIFVTAHREAEAETQGLALGAVDFISKPFNPAVVRARVKTHLTLKAQSDLLRQLAYLDGLTGVYNRRHFDTLLPIEYQRCSRSGGSLAVLLVDVDYFKRYNDCYGHLAGDDCLRRVAQTLAKTLRRPGDLLCRYGGEEFVCLLPDTDLAGALTVAEQLVSQVRALALPHAQSELGQTVSVSVGGAAGHPQPGGEPALLLSVADQQLYAAKQGGRARASCCES
ncbi:diguanylate cyclase domain-containing protein [Paucibacter soli]|uniref:diguanylate cyclase domain-containing protein n=1 Tax=Paucibacter soli TaxID=3133433 RepID=UPI0030A507C8